MADKTAQEKEVESTVEEVDKSKTEETTPVEEDSKSENGDSAKNGQSEEKENGEETEEKEKSVDDTDKVCSVKRKSTTGDATESAVEGATPEKKAKVQETTEAESNGEAKVAA